MTIPKASLTADQAHRAGQTKKATASGWIGSALEFYDFFIYATAAALILRSSFLRETRRSLSSHRWRPTA